MLLSYVSIEISGDFMQIKSNRIKIDILMHISIVLNRLLFFLTERQVIIRTEKVVIFSFSHLNNDLLVAPSAILKKHSR